ncbi:unnamed protein product [Amoebophrya sp. A25]|nr:unnamed protein product [Amoebophrya sp. A25]|eukprot:GSA25T00020653001.1
MSGGGEITSDDVDQYTQQLLEARGAKPGKLIQLMEAEVRKLCNATRMIVLSQPALLELEAPLKICGDIHGQYHDLLRLFEYGGFPPESNYLFLGDYVDRGKQSLETICLLMCYKVKYPENFFLLRGNHECASITRIYGFYDECKRRYNIKLWKTFCDSFNCFPVAAVVDEKILCMHGGLSPEITSMDQIKRIVRPTDVPDTGLLCDLLWADPEKDITGWAENDRGVSFVFGPDVVQSFLRKHDMDLICRAHQVVEDGCVILNAFINFALLYLVVTTGRRSTSLNRLHLSAYLTALEGTLSLSLSYTTRTQEPTSYRTVPIYIYHIQLPDTNFSQSGS